MRKEIKLLTPPDYHFETIKQQSKVDPTKPMGEIPVALSLGSNEYSGSSQWNNTFTYGEFSCIVAGSKMKKSFLRSALIASFIGGSASNYFPNMKTHRKSNKDIVIDIDTEQGKLYAHRVFKRVDDMVGSHYEEYDTYSISHLNGKEMMKYVEDLLEEPYAKGKVRWLAIDGIADFMDNTNDITEAKSVIETLMRWRRIYDMHINVVIHKNRQSDDATGHLGSFIEKKSETIINILPTETEEQNRQWNDPMKVVCRMSRGGHFEPFYFNVNEQGIPYEVEQPRF